MAIPGAESEISLPGNGEESEISLPEDLVPGLTVDVDDYEDTYYPVLSDYDMPDLFDDGDAEAQTNLPGEANTVTQCSAKLCKQNSETAEHWAFLSGLHCAGASDHEQRVYTLILEKVEKKSDWEVLGKKVCKRGFAHLCG